MKNIEEYNDLFVDEEINRKALADTVKPFLKFTKEGQLVFEENFYALAKVDQILVVVLGHMILNDIGLVEKESVHTDEVVKLTGIQKSSVEGNIYGALKGLITVKSGELSIEKYRLYSVIQRLRGSNK